MQGRNEIDAVVTQVLRGYRYQVQTEQGDQMLARVSGFLWFRQVEPAVQSRVRVVPPEMPGAIGTIVSCSQRRSDLTG